MFYTAYIHSFNDKGEVSSRKFFGDFSKKDRAVKSAFAQHTDRCIIEVRRSNPKVHRESFEDRTNEVVYRNIAFVWSYLQARMDKFYDYDDAPEGTTSYFLDCILDKSFEELSDLYEIVRYLTDEEINRFLAQDGSDEYFRCVNGKLVALDKEAG